MKIMTIDNERQVSWIRKFPDDLQLLTIGEMSHSAESRIEAEFVYPQHWPLQRSAICHTLAHFTGALGDSFFDGRDLMIVMP
jgi:hypothetical protein